MQIKHIAFPTFAALLLVGVLGTAHAAERDQDTRDTAALAAMKVTLTQAIATAEQQAGGHAVGADVSREQGAVRIAVEVVGPQGVRTVLVDGQTGQVTATRDGQDSDDD